MAGQQPWSVTKKSLIPRRADPFPDRLEPDLISFSERKIAATEASRNKFKKFPQGLSEKKESGLEKIDQELIIEENLIRI